LDLWASCSCIFCCRRSSRHETTRQQRCTVISCTKAAALRVPCSGPMSSCRHRWSSWRRSCGTVMFAGGVHGCLFAPAAAAVASMAAAAAAAAARTQQLCPSLNACMVCSPAVLTVNGLQHAKQQHMHVSQTQSLALANLGLLVSIVTGSSASPENLLRQSPRPQHHPHNSIGGSCNGCSTSTTAANEGSTTQRGRKEKSDPKGAISNSGSSSHSVGALKLLLKEAAKKQYGAERSRHSCSHGRWPSSLAASCAVHSPGCRGSSATVQPHLAGRRGVGRSGTA